MNELGKTVSGLIKGFLILVGSILVLGAIQQHRIDKETNRLVLERETKESAKPGWEGRCFRFNKDQSMFDRGLTKAEEKIYYFCLDRENYIKE